MRYLFLTLLLASTAFGQAVGEHFCTQVLRLYPQELIDQRWWWGTCERIHDLDRLMGELRDPLLKIADETELSEVTYQPHQVSTTGYLRISGFHGTERFLAAFDSALEKARFDNGLILDLRGAGGGEIETANQVMARLTSAPIEGVRVRRRLAGQEQTRDRSYRIKPRGEWQFEAPVVILVDSGTHWPSQVILYASRERLQMESVGVPTMGTKAVEPRIIELPGKLKVQIPTATVTTVDEVKLVGQTHEPDLNLNKEPLTAYRHPTDPILWRGTDELYRLTGRLEWLREVLRKQAVEEVKKKEEK